MMGPCHIERGKGLGSCPVLYSQSNSPHMKRLWKRHRIWFLAVLPGVLLASILGWHFTPAPERVIRLSKLRDKSDEAHWQRRLRLGTCGKWVVVESETRSMLPLHFTFVNTTTGEIVEWVLPNPSEPYGCVLAPREDATLRILTFRDQQPSRLVSYNPATRAETAVPIRGLPGLPSDLKADGWNKGQTAIVSVRYTERGDLQCQVTDLTTGATNASVEVQGLDLSPLQPGGVDDIDVSLAPDADQAAIKFRCSSRHLTVICDMTSGEVIKKQRLTTSWLWRESLPWQAYGTASESNSQGQKLLLDPAISWRCRLQSRNGDVVACPEELGITYFMDASSSFAKTIDPPKFVPETNGVVSIEDSHASPIETWGGPVLSRLPIAKKFSRNYGRAAHWYNCDTQSFHAFRIASEDEELSGRFAVAEGAVYLMAFPKNGCPQIEIWAAPPVRPTLAIWTASLLVSLSTWFWLRRGENQPVAK